MGARRISEDSWKSQHILLRLVSWLSYGLTRLMIGISGYLRRTDRENQDVSNVGQNRSPGKEIAPGGI